MGQKKRGAIVKLFLAFFVTKFVKSEKRNVLKNNSLYSLVSIVVKFIFYFRDYFFVGKGIKLSLLNYVIF